MPAEPGAVDPAIDPSRVTLHPTTLFAAWLIGLESAEFVQIHEVMSDEGNGRCVWGVLRTLMHRARMSDEEQAAFVCAMRPLARRAGALLGTNTIEDANDRGIPLAQIAAALRDAHRTMVDQT